jgi:hypothetical protein
MAGVKDVTRRWRRDKEPGMGTEKKAKNTAEKSKGKK